MQQAQYNAAGQATGYVVTAPSAWETWSFQYNVRGQMTREKTVSQTLYATVLDIEYRYSSTANDGRIVQQKDWVSGEEVSYQYDELGRLIAAATTGPQWGLSWTYDGFGNRLAQNVTKGTAPVAHSLEAKGFLPDLNNASSGEANDNMIDANCAKTLERFK